MSIQVVEESQAALRHYAQVSPAFTVDTRFAMFPIDGGLGGLSLKLEPVEPPYVKDYDRDDGEGPEVWAERWDISPWGVLSAFDGSRRAGGALVAWGTPEIDMLDGRTDLAVLWDMRVAADQRRRGVGSALFSASMDWARAKGCTNMKIETQNVNVPACRFYARQGCRLAAIDPFAYPDMPEEVQFIWMIDL